MSTNENKIEDALTKQKKAIDENFIKTFQMMSAYLDNWAQNFSMADAIKAKRVEQVNFLLNYVNGILNTGIPGITELASKIHDPELSSSLLECNNQLMESAQKIIDTIKQDEDAFQAKLKEFTDNIKNDSQQKPQDSVQSVKISER